MLQGFERRDAFFRVECEEFGEEIEPLLAQILMEVFQFRRVERRNYLEFA